MTRTGRPTKDKPRLDVLERLSHGLTMRDVAVQGPYTYEQVRWYVRSLRRDGLVLPDPSFSHLDSDGGAALRYALTPSGRLVLEARLSNATVGKSTTGTVGKSPIVRPLERPEGVVESPLSNGGRGRVRLATQIFAGVHAVCVRYDLLGAPSNTSGWHAKHPSGVPMRWMTLGEGRKAVRLQLCGDRTLLARYRVDANNDLPEKERPRDVERRKLAIAEEIRRRMAKALDCPLSEPRYRGTEKWSVLGDPVARALSESGYTIHGERNGGTGNDNSPERGTREYTGPDAVEAVADNTEAMRFLASGVRDLDASISDLKASTRASSQLLVALAQGDAVRDRAIREILVRVAVMEREIAEGGSRTGKPPHVPTGVWGTGGAA